MALRAALPTAHGRRRPRTSVVAAAVCAALGVAWVNRTCLQAWVGSRQVSYWSHVAARHSVAQIGQRAAASDDSAELPDATSSWAALQQSAAAGDADDGVDAAWRLERAGQLLQEASLSRLSKFVTPAGAGLKQEPSDGGDDALSALLGNEEVRYVVDFLSDSDQPGPVSRAFWQAELYLRQLQEVPGERPVEQDIQVAQQELAALEERAPPDFKLQEALERSTLYARQQFVAAVRFGYFLRRARQRLRLEAMVKGGTGTDLGAYLEHMGHKEQVEIVRTASLEAVRALEQRATQLFGEFRELSAALAEGLSALEPLTLSPEGCLRLSIEAIAFGAALFEAEEDAAQHYSLSYSAFGSRA